MDVSHKRLLEGTAEITEPPLKVRRSVKACMQCRARKQKCDGPDAVSPRQPCRRCHHLQTPCSFSTEEEESRQSLRQRTDREIERLQKEVSQHRNRLKALESTVNNLLCASQQQPCSALDLATPHSNDEVNDEDEPERQLAFNASSTPFEPSPAPARLDLSLQAVSIETPLSTIHQLRTLSSNGTSTAHNGSLPINVHVAQDIVSRGLLSIEEAQEAFDLFFSYCHQWAPVLCPHTQRRATAVRQRSPVLFVSVCAIALRFWRIPLENFQVRYSQVVSILDSHLSRLLLQPCPTDINLDHVRALLLYVQWMPFDCNGDSKRASRYNDASIWSVLGLAIRYGLFLRLHSSAMEPFKSLEILPGLLDVARLRVWINLVTCDSNLMLSSGLPASLNPEPVAEIAQAFGEHPNATLDDQRAVAIIELVTIIKRATRSSGDPSARTLPAECLATANTEFDVWGQKWGNALSGKFQHHQMPFTTLRAYQLSINSAGLSSIFSCSDNLPQSLHLLQALDVSLLAAAQTIFALTNEASWQSWRKSTSSLFAFPRYVYTVNEEAVLHLRCSVDSAWITHSFAVVFLVFSYTRRIVNDELQMRFLAHSSSAHVFPQSARPESLFYRLMHVGSKIFSSITTTFTAHPLSEYQPMLDNIFSVILNHPSEAGTEGPDSSAIFDVNGFEQDVETLFGSIMNNQDFAF